MLIFYKFAFCTDAIIAEGNGVYTRTKVVYINLLTVICLNGDDMLTRHICN